MQNGAQLGQTVMGVLQNLEEHELYLYQHQNEIDKLKQENLRLRSKLELLKKEIKNIKKK
jgi:ferredoxin-fold anticodon binding domain-containing protein